MMLGVTEIEKHLTDKVVCLRYFLRTATAFWRWRKSSARMRPHHPRHWHAHVSFFRV